MSRKRLTPAQMDEHVALCDGCPICHGRPPAMTEKEELLQAVEVAEMFGPISGEPYAGPNRAIGILKNAIAQERLQRSANAKPGEPRRSSKQQARLRAEREAVEATYGGQSGRSAYEGQATPAELHADLALWIAVKKSSRGWLTFAAIKFMLDPKTIRNRMKGK